jgi:hypothetical protein
VQQIYAIACLLFDKDQTEMAVDKPLNPDRCNPMSATPTPPTVRQQTRQVQEAAVIGVPHPKWDERPLLVAVPKPGAAPDDALRRDVLAFMASHPDVAKFAVPDDVLFVEAIPYGATGKASLGCQVTVCCVLPTLAHWVSGSIPGLVMGCCA